MDKDKFRLTGLSAGRRSFSAKDGVAGATASQTPAAQLPSVPVLTEEPPAAGPSNPQRADRPSRDSNAPKKSILQYELTTKKIPRQELMNFSRQLSAFIRAGIPILEAIDMFTAEASNKKFKEVLTDVGVALRQGQTFSSAVAAHASAFPGIYVDMLRAAELTGRLDSVLDQLARYIERDLEAKRKVRSALTYPGIIAIMAMVTIGVLTVFVLPRFKTFFASLGAKLPVTTRIVLAAGQFVGHWWWAILLGFLLVVVAGFVAFRTAAGRRGIDRALLRIPVIAEVVRYAIVERFCRILATMVKAGVPLPDAMIVVAETTRNSVYQSAVSSVREAMLRGEGLATPIAQSGVFPTAVVQMMRVGENTGTLDDQLGTAAAFYEQELDYKIKKLTTLFEPAMIVIMGVLVGFVAIALISAMYGIFRQVKFQ